MTKIIYNGRICLGKENFCEALIIENGRILKTGSNNDLLNEIPLRTEKIDACGAAVLPAFNDSHLHLMWVGRRTISIVCTNAASIDEVIKIGREHIKKFNLPAETYIDGAGVNPDLFKNGEKRDLLREDMDKISLEHPIIISRHCGHTVYCNSLALRLAGISEAAPDIEGGTIEKDSSGRPTGVIRENANELVYKIAPAPSREDMKKFIRLGMKEAHSFGITSCGSHDIDGPDFDNVIEAYKDVYDEYKRNNKPGLRVSLQCGISLKENILDDYIKRDINLVPLWEDPNWGIFLKMGSLKLFADGTLGGRTAWMRHPYNDKPETRGFPVLDQERLDRIVKKASGGNIQVLVHAIGDAGIDAVIQSYEKVTEKGNPLRHGIIHCQITSADLLERMADRKILALVQPVFLSDDMHILERRVGQNLASTSYAWNTMQKLGIPVSYSTDAPVSGIDPLKNIEWAVLRGEQLRTQRRASRENCEDTHPKGFFPDEKVDVYSAFNAYTASSAFSNHSENYLGCIAAGFLADLVFLDRDIFAVSPNEIHKTRVLRTMCAGETIYEI